MAPAAVYNWTGLYAGVNAGGVRSHSDITWTTDDSSIATALADAATGKLTTSGFTGGGQIGFNLQSGSLVYGIETDFNYTGVKGDRDSVPVGFTNAMRTTVQSDWLWTTRGRFGATFDRTLVYATGGVAVANVKFADQVGISNLFTNSSDTTRVGWTVGGGIEWAFDPAWSVKAEYLYVDLGKVDYHDLCSAAGVCTTGVGLSHNLTEHIVRLGLNYNFKTF